MSNAKLARLAVIGVFVALIFLGICETAAHAATPAAVHAQLPPVGPYPDAPCEDPDTHGKNIYIGADGSFWECICEHNTFIAHSCAWYNQGPISGSLRRRLKARYHFRAIPRLRVLVLS